MTTRARITFTVEYDLNPDHYPNGWTDNERLSFDIAHSKDSPLEVLSWYDEVAVTGELIPSMDTDWPDALETAA